MKRNIIKILIFLILGIIGINDNIVAQDPIFTQYYNAPLQLNPAFAGNTLAPMVRVNSRVEWPSIGLAYNTYAFSVDRFFHKYNFGSGLSIMMDNSGNGIYERFRIEGITSYRLKVANNKFVKLGLSFAFGHNSLDWDKLIFGDQIDPIYGFSLSDGTLISSNEIRPGDLNISYLDLSAGILYYSKELYLGVAVKHANTPVNYYFQNKSNVNRGLPVRFTAQVGGEIDLASNNVYSKRFYSPSFLFVSQSGINQLIFHNYIDLGSIFAGVGYRYNFVNSDAVLFSVGVSKKMLKISYSFDYTVSELSIGSGGSHEIGISLNFDKSTVFKKPYRYSDCFNMYR